MKNAAVLLMVILMMSTTTAAWKITLREVMEEEWLEYKLRFNKHYPGAKEDVYHKALFVKRRYDVARHNRRYELGEKTYRRAINMFSDLPT